MAKYDILILLIFIIILYPFIVWGLKIIALFDKPDEHEYKSIIKRIYNKIIQGKVY